MLWIVQSQSQLATLQLNNSAPVTSRVPAFYQCNRLNDMQVVQADGRQPSAETSISNIVLVMVPNNLQRIASGFDKTAAILERSRQDDTQVVSSRQLTTIFFATRVLSVRHAVSLDPKVISVKTDADFESGASLFQTTSLAQMKCIKGSRTMLVFSVHIFPPHILASNFPHSVRPGSRGLDHPNTLTRNYSRNTLPYHLVQTCES